MKKKDIKQQTKTLQDNDWFCSHLANNPARHTHPIENGDVDDGGHPSIVDGLRAVRPHVGTLCQVDVARRQTRRRQRRKKREKKKRKFNNFSQI